MNLDPCTQTKCPFGADLQRYWDRLTPIERCMRLDKETLYSLTLQAMGEQMVQLLQGDRIIDPFCGGGGSTIAFARAGRSVIAGDIKEDRLGMTRFNVGLFHVSGTVKYFCEDALHLLERTQGDGVVLDPPWGGPDYWKKGQFGFSDFSPSGALLLDAALKGAPRALFKLPNNFDLNELKSLDGRVQIEQCPHGDYLVCYLALIEREQSTFMMK